MGFRPTGTGQQAIRPEIGSNHCGNVSGYRPNSNQVSRRHRWLHPAARRLAADSRRAQLCRTSGTVTPKSRVGKHKKEPGPTSGTNRPIGRRGAIGRHPERSGCKVERVHA